MSTLARALGQTGSTFVRGAPAPNSTLHRQGYAGHGQIYGMVLPDGCCPPAYAGAMVPPDYRTYPGNMQRCDLTRCGLDTDSVRHGDAIAGRRRGVAGIAFTPMGGTKAGRRTRRRGRRASADSIRLGFAGHPVHGHGSAPWWKKAGHCCESCAHGGECEGGCGAACTCGKEH